MLTLMSVMLAVECFVVPTVAITTTASRLGDQVGLVHVTFHTPTLHMFMVVVLVMRRVGVTRFVSLRREKCMVNLLVARLHLVIWVDYRRVSHLTIVVVRCATQSMAVMSGLKGACLHFLRGIVGAGVVWRE